MNARFVKIYMYISKISLEQKGHVTWQTLTLASILREN